MTRTPCSEVARLLWQFLDQELDSQTRQRITQHLRECEGCGPREAFELRLRAIIREKCRGAPAPESLRLRVMAFLRDL